MYAHLQSIGEDMTTATQEQEIKLREERAEKHPLQIKILHEKYFPFTNYEVTSQNKVRYLVEVRSLKDKINACSCPDFHVNTLGMCKHIEGVLQFIKKRDPESWPLSIEEGSPRIEIFLDQKSQQVCVQYPLFPEGKKAVQSIVDPYFSAGNTLLAEPVAGVSSLEHHLTTIPDDIRVHVRLSPYLQQWIKEKKHLEITRSDKKLFLADVAAGKRSLQMLSCTLFPYQEEGMLHLAFQGRAILADEMGLGKTIQAIAACELLRRLGRVKRVMVVTPASLKGEWEEQIARFTGLPTLMINGARGERLAGYKKESFFYLVNYEQVRNDHEEIQALLEPDIMILDEAQRVKNWQTKTAWAVKRVKTPYVFVLTGTPIENRIEELYSIMQVVDPTILGPLFKFTEDFHTLNEKGKAIKYKNLGELHSLLKPVLLRRRKKDVEEHLPDRTQKNYFVSMTPEQTARYEEYSERVSKLLHKLKKRPLTTDESKKLQQYLACMRMVADTPYILDNECRDCPKLEELEEILRSLTETSDTKIIIFSEWERMLTLVRELADKLQLSYAWHTGSVPQQKRRDDIKRFKEDPTCTLFLTTDSGSTGLNLQVASVVINIDLPWNPAKLEQRIARAWRKNQTKQVQVINLITENTIEHRMLSTLAMKQAVADAVLDNLGNLDELPLAGASREDFINRLEALTTTEEPHQRSLPEPLTSSNFTQDLLARHSDRIHLVEEHPQMLLVVVDKCDASIKESFDKAPKVVELLDLEMYLAIQRLMAHGAIQMDKKNPLFVSTLLESNQRGHKKQKLDDATNHMKEAKRQLKMALLLRSGEFVEEAFPLAKQALKKATDVLAALEAPLDDTGILLQKEQAEDKEAFIESLTTWIEEVEQQLTQYALGV